MLEDLFKVVTARFNGEDGDKIKEETPAEKLFKCPRCSASCDYDELEKNMWVCPSCGYHGRMNAADRLAITADSGSFVEYDKGMTSLNPIDFPDYQEKISSLREKTGLNEAVITGECTIKGERCIIGIMDSHFMMASMGSVVGEKITRAFERAAEKKLPLILFTASGGARMQEGLVSLMQMAKTTAAIEKFKDAGGLFISYLTNPTTGGVSASFASLGDIIIAEPGALICFAGPRVIEQTIGQKLPEGFQHSEFLLEHGMIDMIVDRKDMKQTLSKILKMHVNTGGEA